MKNPGTTPLNMFEREFKLPSEYGEPSTIEQFWLEFKPVVQKLTKEGFRSICEDWWRSRYHESVICPGHSPNRKGYEHQAAATEAWAEIWRERMNSFLW